MKKLFFIYLVATVFAVLSCRQEALKGTPLDKSVKNIKRSFPFSGVYKLETDQNTFYLIDTAGVRQVTVDHNSNISGIYWLEHK